MNFYPFHLGDYAAHTGHLEPMEDLAYRRMLDVYYLQEGPLPADVDAVARLVKLRRNRAEVEAVLREFFALTDDGWRHSRCDAELAKMQDKRAKAQASAAASVNARRTKAPQPPNGRPPSGQRTLSERSTDAELPIPTPIPSSVANATGAKAPPANDAPPWDASAVPASSDLFGHKPAQPPLTAQDAIFAMGVPMLTAAGVDINTARSMLGKLRKHHPDADVAAALQRCAEVAPMQPVPWLIAALPLKPKAAGRPAWVEERKATVDAWAGSAAAELRRVPDNVIDIGGSRALVA